MNRLEQYCFECSKTTRAASAGGGAKSAPVQKGRGGCRASWIPSPAHAPQARLAVVLCWGGSSPAPCPARCSRRWASALLARYRLGPRSSFAQSQPQPRARSAGAHPSLCGCGCTARAPHQDRGDCQYPGRKLSQTCSCFARNRHEKSQCVVWKWKPGIDAERVRASPSRQQKQRADVDCSGRQ